MRNLIRLSINRPVGSVMIFLAVLLLSITGLKDIPVEFLPEIEVPTIVISTIYPSATPKDVRTLVTIPLENALSSVKGLKQLKSVSRNSFSTIILELEWGVDLIQAELQVREILDSQFAGLPDDAFRPQVIPSDPNRANSMIIAFFPESVSLTKLRSLLETEIRSLVQQVPGVGSVTLVGGTKEEVLVSFEPTLAASRGMTSRTLAEQISAMNARYPAGSFVEGTKEYLVIGNAEVTSLNGLEQLNLLSGQAGQQFRLSEIANVKMDEQDQRSLFMVGEREAVSFMIKKQAGANPAQISQLVSDKLEEIGSQYGSVFSHQVVLDESIETTATMNSILLSVVLGGAIAFVVLLATTRRLLLSVLVVLTVPISLAITFLLMKLLGMSFNTMSLGGIAIAVGMLVDNGVIVIENVEARSPRFSTADSVSQVAAAALGSTLTSLIVFLPLVFLPGIIGAVYRDLALTVTSALVVSYIVSITLLPSAYQALGKRQSSKVLATSGKLQKLYVASLKAFIRKPLLQFVAIAAVVVGTIVAGAFVKAELSSQSSDPEIVLTARAEPGTRISALRSTAIQLQRQLSEFPWFESAYFRAGGEIEDSDYYSDPSSASNYLHGRVKLSAEFANEIDSIVHTLQESLFSSNTTLTIARTSDRVSRLFNLSGSEFSWLVTAISWEALSNVNSGFDDLRVFPEGKQTTLEIVPYRTRLDQAGMNPAIVNEFLSGIIQGVPAGRIELESIDHEIRVRALGSPNFTIEQISEMRIPATQQTGLRVGDLAELSYVDQPAALYRENRRDAILVYYPEPELPAGFLEANSFQQESLTSLDDSILAESISEVSVVLLIAFVLLFLYLGAQFESFKEPIILLLTVPLSFLGVFAGLIIAGENLDLNSGLGVLVLLGVVVNGSILLRERALQIQSSVHGKNFSVLNAAGERLRPITITALSTMLSLLPLAFELFGPTQQRGLAIVIIGGLGVSTLLSLYVVPLVSTTRGKKKVRST